jgi:hypothetical protein
MSLLIFNNSVIGLLCLLFFFDMAKKILKMKPHFKIIKKINYLIEVPKAIRGYNDNT